MQTEANSWKCMCWTQLTFLFLARSVCCTGTASLLKRRRTDLIFHSCSYSKRDVSGEIGIECSQWHAGVFLQTGSSQFYFFHLWGLQFDRWSSWSASPRHVCVTPSRVSATKDYSDHVRLQPAWVSEQRKAEEDFCLSARGKKKKKSPESWIKHLENYCSLTAFAACYPGWVITGCRGNACSPPPAADQFCLCEGPLKGGAAQIMQQRHRNSYQRVFTFWMCQSWDLQEEK